jgi:hypothetical protein
VQHLVSVEQFMNTVDSWDLAQRKSQHIENAFHEHWLTPCADGIYLFLAPEFYLTNGRARFINGRHRTLLLSRHLREIPMALTNMDGYPVHAASPSQLSLNAIQRISVRKVSPSEVFDFPDMPVRYLGYDHNIGK